ncbi:MAG: PIN domain-containing protein, partial [Candidatus Promineifilaceae bacterium]
MRVSLDTNVWIFAILGQNSFCERILLNLDKFEVVIPDQVRAELERNLSNVDMNQFYNVIFGFGVTIDYATVPAELIANFERLGLKKGDAEIGAFCEWRQIDVVVSDNRDFLRGLAPAHSFSVMSPAEFCSQYNV